jgi:hypothetical protein
VPNGATIADYLVRVSPGDILSLAAGGTYAGLALSTDMDRLPSGSASRATKIQGNGATITGGAYGLVLGNKSYVDIENLTFSEQTTQSINITGCSYINHANVHSYSSANPDGFNDTNKVRSSSHIAYTDCGAGPVDGVATADGFELWGPCDDVLYTNCVAHGFNNGQTTNDGHGFETYGQAANQACTNVRYVDCEAYGCRVGFSAEGGPGVPAVHDVLATNCNTHDNIEYDYQGINGATLNKTNSPGTTFGSVVDV